jgi:hypothetical protein
VCGVGVRWCVLRRCSRVLINSLLGANERYLTVTAFPGMGVGEFTAPALKPKGPVAMSDYVPDDMISPHPRFATLTRNIRKRRGENVCIRVPLFQDTKTAAAAQAHTAKVRAHRPGMCAAAHRMVLGCVVVWWCVVCVSLVWWRVARPQPSVCAGHSRRQRDSYGRYGVWNGRVLPASDVPNALDR